MQEIYNIKGRYLDVTIGHPSSTSDYLLFVTSKLRTKLETPGFLAPGLVLRGDNAHVSNDYMVTPFKNMLSGSKDTCNFYQSQVRIRVECSFGMLVHRWAILRRFLPHNIPLRKATSMIYCLCKLHNYCLDKNKATHYEQTNIDKFYSSISSCVPINSNSQGNLIPNELLGRGNHSDIYDC